MTEAIANNPSSALGTMARRLRIAQLLTQQELAAIAGVSPEEVNSLEHNLPLCLDAKRKLLRELWARKNHGS